MRPLPSKLISTEEHCFPKLGTSKLCVFTTDNAMHRLLEEYPSLNIKEVRISIQLPLASYAYARGEPAPYVPSLYHHYLGTSSLAMPCAVCSKLPIAAECWQRVTALVRRYRTLSSSQLPIYQRSSTDGMKHRIRIFLHSRC